MPTTQLTRDQVITMLDGLIDKDVNLYTTQISRCETRTSTRRPTRRGSNA